MQFMNHRPRVSLNFHFTQPKMNAQFKSLETRHRFSRKSRRGIKVYFDSRSNRSFPSIWRGESTEDAIRERKRESTCSETALLQRKYGRN
ncbi:hypothetical protein V6Z11_A02G045500 [Gossypium hirsutum]|uniref:Uncharacterized protein isoform X2 n=1 Tax=Gossypium hirsutum TaxID=3635 RepID=A0A1U8MQH5_GOSHI|nr:uncharacterized protein LOC107940166 isoform X2 [Gossypium hirsutum]